MKFLSNGDYIFPFGPALHWAEHLYVWSFQTGAPNLDGIIRLPVRLLNLIVFQLFGNLAIGYFYLIIAVIILFVAFYIFARKFLKIEPWYLCVLGATFFALNPIFLGNLAKVGLVIAVAMLPLMFVAIKTAFKTGQVRYVLFYILLLNVSLVHPYTFTVNLLISGAYFIYLAFKNKQWIMENWSKLAVVLGTGALLCAYFILPILNVGSIDKGVLSQDLSDSPIDYTALVGIANTGDMLTAISLSKNIFLDFYFYNQTYMPVYFLGAFLLILLMFGGYVLAQKNLPKLQSKRVLACFAAVLVLLLLSTATLFNIDVLIKILIDMPGGWMFRSPLKWQLYIPFFMIAALLIVIKYLPKKWLMQTACAIFAVAIITTNGYLIYDVGKKLLVPRQLGEFSYLNEMNLESKTLLFVDSEACLLYAQAKPEIFTEFNQVIGSKNSQMKKVSSEDLTSVNVDSFNYIFSCAGSADEMLSEQPDAKLVKSFDKDGIELYTNGSQLPLIYAPTMIFGFTNNDDLQAKRQFVNSEFGMSLDFKDITEPHYSTGLHELFESVSTQNIKDGQISSTVTPNNGGNQILKYLGDSELFYKQEHGKVTITPNSEVGFSKINQAQSQALFSSDQGEKLDFRYKDSNYDLENLINNASFESGLWREQVDDCNNFDAMPIIGMSNDNKQASDGYKSLQLTAKRHIACTSPSEVSVKPGERYLLSFDYKSSDDKRAGYFVGFDDENDTSVGKRLSWRNDGWQTNSSVVEVPEGATKLKLIVYAYPNYTKGQPGTVNYDNFYLTRVPDIESKFFLLSVPSVQFSEPPKVESSVVSPTMHKITVKGASEPFYIALKDTFHPRWRLALNNFKVDSGVNSWLPNAQADQVGDDDHFVINGSMNGWFVDPEQLCAKGPGCFKNDDGTYDIELVAEFTPQRWMHVGLIISGFAALGAIGYFIYDRRKKGF